MTLLRILSALVVLGAAAPSWADPPEPRQGESERSFHVAESGPTTAIAARSGGSPRAGSQIGWRGWGIRAGITDDPDQVVGGVHFDLGEFVRRLRFQPDVQLGFGDDATTLFATAPVHYRFELDRAFVPYAGGGVSFGFIDRDLPTTSNADDTEFEAGFKATGGLEWSQSRDRAFLLELSLGFGDVHDVQIVAGWSF